MLTILGPTASGKTSLAATIAADIGAEIISADSRQVYRGMDIGTGKDLADYTIDGQAVPYHLIDTCNAGEKYNLFEYQHDFFNTYCDIVSRGRIPLLCGGTGLYIEAVLSGYNLSPVPQNQELRESLSNKSLEELTAMLTDLKRQTGTAMHNTTDVDTVQRTIRAIEIETHNLHNPTTRRELPPISSTIVGLRLDREMRRQRITERLDKRLAEGMVDEIRSLLKSGVSADDLIYYGLEYKYITLYVIGKLSYGEMRNKLEIAIHQFAKRQMTWFRGMERRGFTIHWIEATAPMEQKVNEVKKILKNEM